MMQLHAPTLFAVVIVVMSLIALLLFWSWLQNRAVKTLAWWSVALLLEALGTVLVFLRGLAPDWLSINLSNSLLIVACGVIWTGARLFNGRTVHPSLILGAAIWLVACQDDAFYSSLPARASLFSVLIGSYLLLAAWEFWRGTEPLASRPAAVACLALHGIVFLLHIPAVLLSAPSESTYPLDGGWFIFIALQGIVHSIVAAFLLLAMAKERVELNYKTASRIDSLTGAGNRRSFLASAEQVMTKASRDSHPVGLLMFDLDHFKKINDSFGHQRGDEVLKLFCSTASKHLRPNDVFGRLGGEEFAALLPGVDGASADKVANRILVAFEAAGQSLGHAGLETTASAGIAVSEDGRSSFDDLFAAADRALYQAKRTGRNRVEEDRSPLLPLTLFSPKATPVRQ
jgi:diguanylate cyclase (GGDEF)-like protein